MSNSISLVEETLRIHQWVFEKDTADCKAILEHLKMNDLITASQLEQIDEKRTKTERNR